MRQNSIPICWTCVVLFAVTAGGDHLRAADQAPSADGYRIVPVNVGGRTIPLRVKDQANPFRNVTGTVNTSGKYDPQSVNFSATSSMANKSFSSANAVVQSGSDFKNRDENSFITKTYPAASLTPAAPDLETKANVPTAHAFGRNAGEFDKTYPTARADTGESRTAAYASTTLNDENKKALFASRTIDTPTSSLAGKTFEGPEADAVRRHLTKTDDGRIVISDLPNRPLTIDEVRDLINHGFKPDTEARPAESSKALNDPNYVPQPLRDVPEPDASSPASDDDKNDAVPPPGTMAVPPASAPPENAEPLPQP